MPAFYHQPEMIMDTVHQSIGKALDQIGIEHNLFKCRDGHGRRQPQPESRRVAR